MAQLGSAGALGALGRRFESCRPDQLYQQVSANNKLHPKKVAPKMHPNIIFSRIIGITLESAIWFCPTYGVTIKGFSVAPFFYLNLIRKNFLSRTNNKNTNQASSSISNYCLKALRK